MDLSDNLNVKAKLFADQNINFKTDKFYEPRLINSSVKISYYNKENKYRPAAYAEYYALDEQILDSYKVSGGTLKLGTSASTLVNNDIIRAGFNYESAPYSLKYSKVSAYTNYRKNLKNKDSIQVGLNASIEKFRKDVYFNAKKDIAKDSKKNLSLPYIKINKVTKTKYTPTFAIQPSVIYYFNKYRDLGLEPSIKFDAKYEYSKNTKVDELKSEQKNNHIVSVSVNPKLKYEKDDLKIEAEAYTKYSVNILQAKGLVKKSEQSNEAQKFSYEILMTYDTLTFSPKINLSYEKNIAANLDFTLESEASLYLKAVTRKSIKALEVKKAPNYEKFNTDKFDKETELGIKKFTAKLEVKPGLLYGLSPQWQVFTKVGLKGIYEKDKSSFSVKPEIGLKYTF